MNGNHLLKNYQCILLFSIFFLIFFLCVLVANSFSFSANTKFQSEDEKQLYVTSENGKIGKKCEQIDRQSSIPESMEVILVKTDCGSGCVGSCYELCKCLSGDDSYCRSIPCPMGSDQDDCAKKLEFHKKNFGCK